MPPLAFKTRSWADPANASVLDDFWTKSARTIGQFLGVNDPESQVMAIAAPVEVPGGGPPTTMAAYHGGPTEPVRFYDWVDKTQTRPDSVYRGISSTEFDSIKNTGVVKSTGKYSHTSEGTSFADDHAVAESSVNFGRKNPAVTGKPTYVIEVKRGPEIVTDPRDYWPKAKDPIPASRITRAWRFDPNGTVTPLIRGGQ